MRANDNELLRRYLRDRSETAFAELVERHLGLVYSAALRQVNGDTQAAEDVAQAVFLDLARKASSVSRHSSLTGWLYTSTRYLAANARRAASRRRAHEETAQIMNELLRPAAPEPDWARLRPALDEAMHDLNPADREAVLWRYFEKHAFTEIGARLGLNENAARMRVERALEKLRSALAKRGVTSTASVLALLVTNQAVGAVPANLAPRISHASVVAAGAGGTAALIATLLASTKAKTAVAVLVLAAVIGLTLATRPTPESAPHDSPAPVASHDASNEPPVQVSGLGGATAPASNAGDASALSAVSGPHQLQLKLVAADSGDPVPHAEVQCLRDFGSDTAWETMHSDSNGLVNVALPESLSGLDLYVRVDGFASTSLAWHPPRGETIPSQHVLQMARAATLGGWVVGATGAPVAGAIVEGAHPTDTPRASQRETHLASFETKTDASGKWESRRVAPELVRALQIHAHHPDYGSSASVDVESSAEIESLLRAQSYTLRLTAADEVSGQVVDPESNAVAGASVLLGRLNTSDLKKTKTDATGHFHFAGVPRGKQVVTGNANGFATTSVHIDAGPDLKPVQLVLSRGKTLAVSVVDESNQPIVGAEVFVNESHPAVWTGNELSDEFRLDQKTGADGRVLFPHVPDAEIQVGAVAKGHMEVCGQPARPGGDEVVVSLGPELVVSGTVKDGATGALIPRVKMVAGEPEAHGTDWSTIDRFQMSFEGGSFRHVLAEATSCIGTNSGYLFKFEADGYAPFVSRYIAPDEREARLDVALQPVSRRDLTVLNPDGTPAAGADVGFPDLAISSGSSIPLIPGGLSRRFSRTDDAIRQADDQGHVQCPEDGIHRVVAAGAAGYAEADLSSLPDNIIRLQPWGRVEGTLPNGDGQPSSHEVQFQYEGLRPSTGIMAEFFSGYRLHPDKDGKFVFPLVPPGHHRVVELIPDNLPPEAATHSWQNGRAADVEVHAGETVQVTLEQGAKLN